ncbi:hypothetical protein BDR07DRAFT_1388396 [Suillus spraguei]|nr:hypothetical protein BDR07DRAFT_1388396 [Suillus spraguei]
MNTETVTPRRGALRCNDMVLGPYGTAARRLFSGRFNLFERPPAKYARATVS